MEAKNPRTIQAMAKAYSDDLRRKLLEAHDRGEGSLRVLAKRFGVSVPWAWKISRQRRRSGQMERVEQRHGPPSRMTAAVQASLRGLVRQQRLWASERVRVSFQHLWRVLQNMGLRLKKSRSTPKSKTRSRSKPVVRRGGRR